MCITHFQAIVFNKHLLKEVLRWVDCLLNGYNFQKIPLKIYLFGKCDTSKWIDFICSEVMLQFRASTLLKCRKKTPCGIFRNAVSRTNEIIFRFDYNIAYTQSATKNKLNVGLFARSATHGRGKWKTAAVVDNVVEKYST